MIKRSASLAVTAAIFLTAGCNEKHGSVVSGEKPPVSAEAVAVLPPVPTALGFASRVPKDADVFISGYHADQMFREITTAVTTARPGPPKDPQSKIREEENIQKAMATMGDEVFLFIGSGAGGKLQTIGKTYQKLAAGWAEVSVGAMLGTLADQKSKPDFEQLADQLSKGFLDQMLDAVEKDSGFRIPSVVIGWKPAPEKEGECLLAVEKGIDDLLKSSETAKPVTFEASGVKLVGYEFPGREVFAEIIAEGRRKLEEKGGGDELLKHFSPERIERLLAALEKVNFTVATGAVDGRVLIYFGNGKDGFALAESPAESLAATESLRWTSEFSGKRITGATYLSDSVVQSVLPWLDSSEYWNSVARAIRPPVKEERLLRDLLTRLAETDGKLAKRDASAWSAIICEDNGWRFESRGGWPDPSLDFETPLRMTSATLATKPAIRAQWIQNRERKDLEWKRLETFGLLIEATLGEFQQQGNPTMAMIPEGTFSRVMNEVRAINHGYRDEYRAGIGDEVALVVDFQGEVPAFPGISEDTVKNGRLPRFVFARPVTDRAKLDAAGKSYGQSWRSLTAWASELSGENLPLILPQSLESDGLVTWYPPLPFIGGDFVPGVTMNDEVWMLGTSRSMAKDFSRYVKTPDPGGDTGMIVEIEFAPIREWLKDVYHRNKLEAKSLAEDVPDEMRQFTGQESMDHLGAAVDRLQGLGYRKWMADAKSRTSLHLRINPQ